MRDATHVCGDRRIERHTVAREGGVELDPVDRLRGERQGQHRGGKEQDGT